MSAPRDVDPHLSGPGPGDEDHDPTGVRALLAALPDPGPMPPELIHRIHESLAAEQGTRVHHGSRADGYARLTDGDPLTSERGAGSSPARFGTPTGSPAGADSSRDADTSQGDASERHSADGASVHPFSPRDSGPRRPSPLRRLPAIAIAASVVVLAGAVVLGILATQLGLDGSTSMDTAVQATMGGADAGSAADESSGGAQEDGADGADAAESAPLSSPLDGAAAMSAAPVVFLSSGAVVTTANLAGHARAVRDGSSGVVDESSRAVMAQSPVGTAEGAADCIGGLLDRPAADIAALLTVVDFVRYDGAHAALILVREPGSATDDSGAGGESAGPGEASTAYLVPVDCGSGPAVTLQAPVRLDS